MHVCLGQQVAGGLSGDASAPLHSGLSDAEAADVPAWPAERVIFLNDVFFCAHDVVRLLQHDADIVCGMDFDRPKLEEAPMQACQLAMHFRLCCSWPALDTQSKLCRCSAAYCVLTCASVTGCPICWGRC